jgi:glucose-1-phosphate cytidylyltransferase
MDRLIDRNKLGSFVHEGYWQSMDSLRDRHVLEEQWAKSPAWKVWA